MYKPKKGQAYWMINSRFQVVATENNDTPKSKARIEVGNCFETHAEADAARYLMKELVAGKLTGFKRRRWWRF